MQSDISFAIDGIAVKALKLDVLYENIRENDADKVGFTTAIKCDLIHRAGMRQEGEPFGRCTLTLRRAEH